MERHHAITNELIALLGADPSLKSLLEQAIAQASAINPDPDTNPAQTLEDYYAFVDRVVTAMPWEINPSGKFPSLYWRIDQGMGCFYFIGDQPLEALKSRGYYHPSLMYHEPFRSWVNRFVENCGQFLDTPESWGEEYAKIAFDNPDFHLNDGTYEDPSNWHTFNMFFTRALRAPEVRPIAEPEDDSVLISPTDATPQGLWHIGEDSRVILSEAEREGGRIPVKTTSLSSIQDLLLGSNYADCFAGGTLTHTFLDINDYHRYHFPVSGTVLEVGLVPGADAPGGVIRWYPDEGYYHQSYCELYGWQSVETRGYVIVDTGEYGLAAIVPVGMCQVSSVNFRNDVQPGTKVRRCDPLGCFKFGGSDIVMIFQKKAGFRLTAEPGKHLKMGEEYGRFAK
ncbi:MAG: phosphatidylserine decarboxylase [Firmicutes bacterium]|nr:phosphatidylserine decarboxylase [Bacillota bacterium]